MAIGCPQTQQYALWRFLKCLEWCPVIRDKHHIGPLRNEGGVQAVKQPAWRASAVVRTAYLATMCDAHHKMKICRGCTQSCVPDHSSRRTHQQFQRCAVLPALMKVDQRVQPCDPVQPASQCRSALLIARCDDSEGQGRGSSRNYQVDFSFGGAEKITMRYHKHRR